VANKKSDELRREILRPQKLKESQMKHRIAKLLSRRAAGTAFRGFLAGALGLATCGIAAAQLSTNNQDLKFKGAIGVIPVTGVAANGAVNLNVVRGVPPGAPWRITDLNAVVSPDGHIRVVGRGLLLATGNGIGTNAGQSVHASLFCGPATTATEQDTNLAGVALEADGDFRIDDYLSSVQPIPCTSPVLLIRNVGGVWFAAGIPKVETDQDAR
jgi:hypothetical protein